MSAVPHSLPDDLQHARPAPTRSGAWARAFLRECGWLLLTGAAATAALALFVLVTELHTGEPLVERLLRPINLLRLAVMTGCLGLWSYILRSARGAPARRALTRDGAVQTRAGEAAGRG